MARHNHYRDSGFARGKMMTLYHFPLGIDEDIVEVAKRELAKGVARVVADAKSRCPVRTGKLRLSIKAQSNEDDSMFYISANAYRETHNIASTTGGRFYYGQMVEFSPKINKPFLYPALDANREQISKNIKAAVLREVNRHNIATRRTA